MAWLLFPKTIYGNPNLKNKPWKQRCYRLHWLRWVPNEAVWVLWLVWLVVSWVNNVEELAIWRQRYTVVSAINLWVSRQPLPLKCDREKRLLTESLRKNLWTPWWPCGSLNLVSLQLYCGWLFPCKTLPSIGIDPPCSHSILSNPQQSVSVVYSLLRTKTQACIVGGFVLITVPYGL